MSTLYVTEDWTFTPSTLTLKYLKLNEEIVLDPKTARLLGYFLRSYPKVCTREEIYQELYGIENARADGTITAYVSKLRKLLETNIGAKGKYIKTIPKTGYQFIGTASIQHINHSSTPAPQVDDQQHSIMSDSVSLDSRATIQRFYTIESGIIIVLVLCIAFLIGKDEPEQSISQSPPQVHLSTTDWNLIHAESGINQSVALSNNGLFIAFVSTLKNSNTLFIKSIMGDQLNKVFELKNGMVESPAFAPNGLKLAYITREKAEGSNESSQSTQSSFTQCFINLLDLDENHQVITDSHQQIASCDPSHPKAPLSFIDNDQIAFLAYDASDRSNTLSYVNTESRLVTSLMTNDLAEHGQIQSFTFNDNTQQLAILSNKSDNEAGNQHSICLFDLVSKENEHVLNVHEALSGIEWLSNEKLIVKKGQQLQLVDLNKKDIKSISLAQLKQEIGTTKS